MLDVRDNIRYLCCLSMHRQQAECDLTPGALSEPHSMQLYHPYSGQVHPPRRQSSCCGCDWSVSSARWRRTSLSFCLPAPPGSRKSFKLQNILTDRNVHVVFCCFLKKNTRLTNHAIDVLAFLYSRIKPVFCHFLFLNHPYRLNDLKRKKLKTI